MLVKCSACKCYRKEQHTRKNICTGCARRLKHYSNLYKTNTLKCVSCHKTKLLTEFKRLGHNKKILSNHICRKCQIKDRKPINSKIVIEPNNVNTLVNFRNNPEPIIDQQVQYYQWINQMRMKTVNIDQQVEYYQWINQMRMKTENINKQLEEIQQYMETKEYPHIAPIIPSNVNTNKESILDYLNDVSSFDENIDYLALYINVLE